jgi:hypothetical protein
MRDRTAVALVFAVLCAAGLAGAAAAVAPTLDNVSRDPTYFSPNADGVRDSVRWRFTLAVDTAKVIVLVHADSLGSPGPIVAVLSDVFLPPVTDSLAWGGEDDDGDPAAEGRYWITGRAENPDGTSTATPLDVFLDRTAPLDSITTPARPIGSALVHRVEGWATDAYPLDTLRLTLTSGGGNQEFPICAPCVADTTLFGIDVPDAIALDDTVTVVSEAIDRAGNRTLKSRLFVVDSLPPAPPVLDALPPTVDRPSVTVAGTASGADSVLLRRDGTTVARLRVTSARFQTAVSLPAIGTYTFDALALDRARNISAPGPVVSVSYIEPIGVDMPERFLAGDRIQVNLTSASRRLTVRVLSLAGRLVRTFETEAPGPNFEFTWDLTDDDGRDAGSGPYVVRVQADLEDGTSFEKRVAMVVTR